MSMLAEKKKREKWCLNPRGKSWSDGGLINGLDSFKKCMAQSTKSSFKPILKIV